MKEDEYNEDRYRILEKSEPIKEGDFHSWEVWSLKKIPDDYIGKKPDDFPSFIQFLRLVKE